MTKLIQEYISSLNDQETIALDIARTMLETSFDIEKSIGYKKWLKAKNNKSK
jgi:hypothetical protein